MPIYRFQCKKCGHVQETIQGSTEPSPPCEKCSGEMEKKMGRGSFSLKGSGWYKDGYS